MTEHQVFLNAMQELEIKRRRAQGIVDRCDQALTSLRELTQPDAPAAPASTSAVSSTRQAAVLAVLFAPKTFDQVVGCFRHRPDGLKGLTGRKLTTAVRNDLQALKRARLVTRAGHTWVKA